MGVITTSIISFTVISVNLGFPSTFISIWLRSWAIAYIVAVPLILIIAPRIQEIVNRLFKTKVLTK